MRYLNMRVDDQTLIVPEFASCFGCGRLCQVVETDDHGMHALTLADHTGRHEPWQCQTSTWYVSPAPATLNMAWGPSFGPIYLVLAQDTVELVGPAARGHELGERYLRVDAQLFECVNLDEVRDELGAAA